ncbi:PH domain-containing protein DDB_G0287875-like [Ischnura elegans]|uniref:PH domain-containing protein DDB_G0287875-like n=1 Tax=Ischnura elegans TaxID=197161 RepID=UPI001ED89768|nr:PH domain-containing protein DDB_G0287875-like [Ischnura elegans]
MAKLNEEQKNILLEFVEGNDNIAKAKFTSKFGAKDAADAWREVTVKLNSCGGAVKQWKEWRKTWQDIKTFTKAKVAALVREGGKTGGDPPSVDELTSYQMRVYQLLGSNAVMGHQHTKESQIIVQTELEAGNPRNPSCSTPSFHPDSTSPTSLPTVIITSPNISTYSSQNPNTKILNVSTTSIPTPSTFTTTPSNISRQNPPSPAIIPIQTPICPNTTSDQAPSTPTTTSQQNKPPKQAGKAGMESKYRRILTLSVLHLYFLHYVRREKELIDVEREKAVKEEKMMAMQERRLRLQEKQVELESRRLELEERRLRVEEESLLMQVEIDPVFQQAPPSSLKHTIALLDNAPGTAKAPVESLLWRIW